MIPEYTTNSDAIGTLRILLDVSLAKKHGWKYKTNLDEGLSNTINDYLQKYLIEKK
jgi:nucleoside-diphosphate-sugar epimerase